MSYWVTISLLAPRYRGTISTMGWGEMTTPAAWVEAWRGSPSRDWAMVRSSRIVGVVFGKLLEAGFLGQGLLQGDVQDVRDHLGDPVHLAVRHVQGPAHVPDHGPGLHFPEGDDLGHVVLAVLFGHILEDLLPALDAEIDVDIRAAPSAPD